MAITASGIGSGLDIDTIVSQLMSLERQPLNALEDKESEFKAQLSAYGQLKSALSTFQDAMDELGSLDKFKVFTAASSNEDVLTATADSNAAAGLYSLDVTRLAQHHKMGSDEFADTDTFGGTAGDSLTLTVGADAMTVDLSTAQTLTEIRDAINSDTANPGVTATILNTGVGQRLILTADESGYDSRVQLSYGGTVNAATFNFATTNQDGTGATLVDLTELDAAYSVDGFALTSASNKITNVIDGITLELKQTGAADLNLTRDTDKIKESAQAFVDAYNAVQGTLNKLREGKLEGDSTLRNIQSQLRTVINTPPSGLTGSYSAIFEVGITTDAKTGELNFDSADFEAALDTDFSSVAELFAHDDQGVAFRFAAVADSLLDTDGVIDVREDGLNDRISDLQDDQRDMEYQLELKEKALRAQYTALDSLIGQLNSTSQFLTQQLYSG
jgi:flagellar hook-associated protein 2